MQELINPDLIALREMVEINTHNISRLEGVVSQLEKRIDNLENKVRDFRIELVGRIDSINAKLSGRIDRMGAELSDRLNEVQTELGGRIDQTNSRIDNKIDQLNDRISKVSDSTDNIYKWMIGLILLIWVAIGIALIKFLISG